MVNRAYVELVLRTPTKRKETANIGDVSSDGPRKRTRREPRSGSPTASESAGHGVSLRKAEHDLVPTALQPDHQQENPSSSTFNFQVR